MEIEEEIKKLKRIKELAKIIADYYVCNANTEYCFIDSFTDLSESSSKGKSHPLYKAWKELYELTRLNK